MLHLLRCNNIVRCREDTGKGKCTLDLTGQWIKLHDPVNLVAEKLNPDTILKRRYRKDIYDIALHTESSSREIHLIPCVLNINQLPDQFIPVLLHTRAEREHHVLIFFRITQTIDAGYGRYDDYILPFDQG